MLFTLTREEEDVRSVFELRIVHDDRALDYSTGGDFHEQMILRTRTECTIDAELVVGCSKNSLRSGITMTFELYPTPNEIVIGDSAIIALCYKTRYYRSIFM